MANRIYVEQSVTLEDAYVASIGSANVESVDFVRAFEDVRVQINAWVSGRTAGLIPNLIPPGVLSSNTVLAAINALYFKGNWQTRFPLDRTMDDTFHAVAGDQTVPFMSLSGQRFRVKEVDALDAVLFAMPYEGNAFTMYVLLPNTLDGWRTAEQSLSGQIGTLFGDGFVEREVDLLRVPKWEMELTLDSLSNILVNLGLSTAFSSGADFSGITQDAPLAISEVIHMAKITVDEEVEIPCHAVMTEVACRARKRQRPHSSVFLRQVSLFRSTSSSTIPFCTSLWTKQTGPFSSKAHRQVFNKYREHISKAVPVNERSLGFLCKCLCVFTNCYACASLWLRYWGTLRKRF